MTKAKKEKDYLEVEWGWMKKVDKQLRKTFGEEGTRLTIPQFRKLIRRFDGLPKTVGYIDSQKKVYDHRESDNTIQVSYGDLKLLTHADLTDYFEEVREEFGVEALEKDPRYEIHHQRVMDGYLDERRKREYLIRQRDEERDEKVLDSLLLSDLTPKIRGLKGKKLTDFLEDTTRDLHEELISDFDSD